MRAERYKLIRFFPTADFRHHIFGGYRTAHPVGHLEMHAHWLPRAQESRDPFGIFSRHHRLRHFFQLAIDGNRVAVEQ